ncbi:Uncharacterised protein (plasmid) [Legionella adelaidensis]|uniref:Uncharacterized protein n=1 Tax=Legionella adelaidensis TaxID=45056 RepID=A0A0W0R0N7_9GAMM|nr:hypothetical protein [Legionella adelaidensis]KTC64672.1 hypothetical protein Lade_1966 [Legionella adelaidensis]VEH86140.1 Uncharacterised protein [Legionella adelaidensis]
MAKEKIEQSENSDTDDRMFMFDEELVQDSPSNAEPTAAQDVKEGRGDEEEDSNEGYEEPSLHVSSAPVAFPQKPASDTNLELGDRISGTSLFFSPHLALKHEAREEARKILAAGQKKPEGAPLSYSLTQAPVVFRRPRARTLPETVKLNDIPDEISLGSP